MEGAPNNPATNKLGHGLTEAALQAAVSNSGYPLQAVVAGRLRPRFNVSQEWAYLDSDSGDLRTMDILAERMMWLDVPEQPRVRPEIDLIIECKRSDLPYVFFLGEGFGLHTFPFLCGLFSDHLKMMTDDSRDSWNLPIQMVLGLDSLAFATEPKCCMSFSKCVRQGKDIELSGEEVFNKAVLPVVKAMKHFRKMKVPPKTAAYFDLHLVIGLVVIDAPMVGVHVSDESHDLMLMPWVRIVRHEGDKKDTDDQNRRPDDAGFYTIDFVHADFLPTYLDKHLMPFAEKFSRLAMKHDRALGSGKAFAKGLRKNSYNNIEPRLKPK